MTMMSEPEPATQQELLARTYRSNLPDVFGFLLRRLDGRRAEAEGLTRETYLAYVTALRRGDDIEQPAAWLQTVARNKLVDHLRKRGRRVEADARLSSDEPVILQSRGETESLLHELPPAQRAAMILRYLDDLPVAEVATLTNRSVDATESLLARGRTALSPSRPGALMTDTELKNLLSAPDWSVEPASLFVDDLETLLLEVLEGDVEPPKPRSEPHTRHLALAWVAAVVLVAALLVLEVGNGEPEPGPSNVTAPTMTRSSLATAGQDESITVSSDMVTVGAGLIIQDLAQVGDLTYVSAGRMSTQVGDRPPEVGVIAAISPSGEELWRTEIRDEPTLVAADADWVWTAQFAAGTAVRLAPESGDILESVHPVLPTPFGGAPEGDQFIPVGLETGFGSVWMHTIRGAVARIEPDGSWAAIEIPAFGPQGLAIGADAVWVALGTNGVARIDAADNEITVVSAQVIGHEVGQVAADGAVVFVGSDFGQPGQVSSIMNGDMRATVELESPIRHLGRVFGFFGVLTDDGRFAELIPEEPMIIDVEQTFNLDTDSVILESQGSAWLLRRPSTLRRIYLAGNAAAESPIPVTEPTGLRPISDQYTLSPDWEPLPAPPVDLRLSAPFGWSGNELIVWVGESSIDDELADGAAFDPVTSTWRALDDLPRVEMDSRQTQINETLLTSGLSPNSRDGAWIGDHLVGVGYLLESAVYDTSTESWSPGSRVPLDSSECPVKVHAVGETVVVDYCGRLAVGGPHAWTPLAGPTLPTDYSLWFGADGDEIWAYSQEGLFRLTADLDDPSSFRRLPLGPTTILLPEGWTVPGPVAAEPITIDVTGPGGSCSLKAYQANAGPLLTELARNGFGETSVEPLVGGEPYQAIEYTADDRSVHLAFAPLSTSVIDVGCADRQTAVEILRSIVWPWQ